MPQRLKRQPENIYHSKKSFKPAKGLIPLGGGGGGLNKVVIQGGSILRSLPFYTSVLKEEGTSFGRSFFCHYRDYPPGNMKNCQRVPTLLVVPENFLFIVKLKRTFETFPFLHLSRKYFVYYTRKLESASIATEPWYPIPIQCY